MIQLTLAFGFLLIIILAIEAHFIGISFTPTSRRVRPKLYELIQSLQVPLIYDFGAGLGTMAIDLQTHCKKPVIAVEKSVLLSFVLRLLAPIRKKVQWVKGDFCSIPIEEGACIYCYSAPKIMVRLEKALLEKKFKGYLISYFFQLPNQKPIRVIDLPTLSSSKLYLYRFF